MARIVHIALKVEDLEKAARFYETVFGFQRVEEGQVRDHTSRHLSDGTIDLALIKYQQQSPEALLSGKGPCIHHFGIEVEDLEGMVAYLRSKGVRVSRIEARPWEGTRVARINRASAHGVAIQLIERP